MEVVSTSYSVYIGNEQLLEIDAVLEQHQDQFSKIFLLTDDLVMEHCMPVLLDCVPFLKNAEIIELPHGEQHKNIDICKEVWETLSEAGADRKSLLVNLGGGVITDMGGFIASTYQRGIRFINIPTSLLAQVDASIGGKVAVDLAKMKNQIGLFSDPLMVVVAPIFLETLDDRQYRSGLAEMIKHALIADAAHWETLYLALTGQKEIDMVKLLQHSIEIKNKVVLMDQKEAGIRKILNFGHTIGHAIEGYFLEEEGTPVLHGEAVAAGMICEAWLSQKYQGLKIDEFLSVQEFLMSLYPKISIKEEMIDELLSLMFFDKKNRNGDLHFSLIPEIGSANYDIVLTKENVAESLKHYIDLVSNV